MAGVMGSQQAKQSNSRHRLLDWPDTDKNYLYPGRDIIGLNIPWFHPDAHEVEPDGIREVYCRKGEREEILNFFKTRLQNVKIVEEKYSFMNILCVWIYRYS